jgi:hypothetical protein
MDKNEFIDELCASGVLVVWRDNLGADCLIMIVGLGNPDVG